jgi:hypothetical protein
VLVLCGLVTSTFLPDVLNFERLDPPERALAVFGATVTALLIFFVVARVVYYWRGVVLRLTPRGLLHRAPLFSRFIPWEALVPGTPEPPPSRAWQASTIQLAVSLPNLVELRGMQRVAGDPRRPLVLAQTLVDATLLAWAIRWYAEHPEHRAGIGTPVEHDRLVAALPPPH